MLSSQDQLINSCHNINKSTRRGAVHSIFIITEILLMTNCPSRLVQSTGQMTWPCLSWDVWKVLIHDPEVSNKGLVGIRSIARTSRSPSSKKGKLEVLGFSIYPGRCLLRMFVLVVSFEDDDSFQKILLLGRL